MRSYDKNKYPSPFEGCLYELNDELKTRIYIVAVGKQETITSVFYIEVFRNLTIIKRVSLYKWKRRSIFKNARLIKITSFDFNGKYRGAGFYPRVGFVHVFKEQETITIKKVKGLGHHDC